jgi:hypothetical protein
MAENVLTLPNGGATSQEDIMQLPQSMFQREERSPREVSRDASYWSVATGRGYEEARDMIENQWEGILINDARGSEQAALHVSAETLLDLNDEEVGSAISDTITQLQEVDQVSRFLPPSLEAAVRSNAPGARGMAIDRIAKLQYAGEQFSQVMEDFGWNSETAIDYAEVLVDPLSITRVPLYRRLTTQFEDLLSPDVSPEAFEEGLDAIITEAMDAGWMSDENRLHFATFLDFLGSGVYSNTARAEAALGWFDIGLTLGTSSILRGAVGAARGTNGTLNGTTAITTGVVPRGPSGAVVDGARNNIHGLAQLQPSARRNEAIIDRTTEAILIDEIDSAGVTRPSILTPTTVRHSFYSAPEATALRVFERSSRALDIFRGAARDAGVAFDDQAFQAFRQSFGEQRFRALQTESTDLYNPRAIDVDVGIDDLGNIFWMDVLGKSNGQAFSAKPNGLRAARAVMQEGDDLLQNADGTYVILRRGNINPENLDWLSEVGYSNDLEGMALFRATNPDALSDGFWARFGSPLGQADPETSSYLYRAEGVMNRTMSTLHREMRRARFLMRPRQISEVYQAFEWLAQQGRPNGFTRETFDNWFAGQYQRAPTDRQWELYRLEQQYLDAQLYINANEVYRNAVAQNARAMVDGETTYIVRPVGREEIEGSGQIIYDTRQQRLISVDELGVNDRIYENIGSTDLPAEALYVRGVDSDIRAIRHTDFFFRNAGGHRGYVVNAMQFLVKQRQIARYAGGIEREGNPVTLLGARTSEEAKDAAESINSIIDTIQEVIPVNGRSAKEYVDALEAYRSNRRIDDAIAASNRWNLDIENLEDLVRFSRDRGLDLRTRFDVVPEGQRLDEIAGSSIYRPKDGTASDLVRMQITTSGRASMPLPSYGGGHVPMRSTEEVLQGSYASSVAYVSEAAYKMRAGYGLIKAAEEAGVFKPAYYQEGINKLPVRSQIARIVREGLIDTSGAAGATDNIGRRLMLDAKRLDFRLSNVSPATRVWRSVTRTLGNYLYRKGWKGLADKADRWSTDPVSFLRGWAFDAYLGMFNPSQLLMQSVQVVNIVGIAGLRGIQGGAMVPVMRALMANGNPNVINRVGRLLKPVTGLEPEQFADMLDLFRRSGRDITDMNLAELTATEDAASAVGVVSNNAFMRAAGQVVRSTREGGRIFFKEGDLIARLTAFNASYLEAVAKYGPRSAANDADFVRFIDWRQQVLTQGMTAASRQAYEQLPFMQFMTYQLRINEALFAGTFSSSKAVLTRNEKLRLAATHLAMFGMMSSTGTGLLSQWYLARNETELDPDLVRAFHRGALDAALSYFTESETAASSRFSSSMGLYNLMQGLQNDGFAFFGGPGIEFGVNATRTMLDVVQEGARAIATGETAGFEAELTDLVRLTSSGNYSYNAYTAMRFGTYHTRRGQRITNDLDPGLSSDAIFTAFGIPLEEVAAVYEFMGQDNFKNAWLRNYANSITETHRRAQDAVRENDTEAAEQFYRALASMYAVLEPWERERVDRMVDNSARTLDDRLMLQMYRQQSQYFEMTTEGN